MPNHYTTIAICSPGYDFSCLDFNDQHCDTNLCAVVRPMPEDIEQIPATRYADGTTERERRGESTDWYDWANEHWGTKWGTYGLKAFSLGGDRAPICIKFQSAWSAPKEDILILIRRWLCRVGGFNAVVFIGFNPYDERTTILSQEGTL